MTDPLVVLTPLLVLLILALFRFTGCKPFGGSEGVGKVEGPPLTGNPPPPPPPPTYEQVVTTSPGFAAYWPLDEGGGNVFIAKSAITPDVNASLEYATGVPAAAGKVGVPSFALKDLKANRAPEFDGTGAYLEVPFNSSLNPGNALKFSVELWVKPKLPASSSPVTQVLVSSVRVDAKRGYEIALIAAGPTQHPQVRARVFSSTNPVTVLTAQNLAGGSPEDWRHIVMTYSGTATGVGTLALHVRILKVPGVFSETTAAARYENVAVAADAKLLFGAGHGSGQKPNNFFAGRIDEVAFYNSVLSETDMINHFNMAS